MHLGLHRRCPGHQVQQGKLTETVAFHACCYVLRLSFFNGVLCALPSVVFLHGEHLKLSLLHNVKIVCVEITLRDDLLTLLYLLFPRDVNHLIHASVVQIDKCLHALILSQSRCDELPLLRILRRGCFSLHRAPSATATNSFAIGKHQLFVETQLLELVPADFERGQVRVGGDRCRPRFVSEKSLLAKVIASLQHGHLLGWFRVHDDRNSGLTLSDHVEFVSSVTLFDDHLAALELASFASSSK
mmetsp:Transcript_4191/g.11837  ORF Transcript_4191/g.11837 Transcript_4191/m.11837 type:complete len:244 (+) Transcript_4191:2195-2926(+)